MLAGTFGKLGATYTIDMRIIDVETGSILRTTSFDIRGEIDRAVTDGLAEAVRSITGTLFEYSAIKCGKNHKNRKRHANVMGVISATAARGYIPLGLYVILTHKEVIQR